MFDIPGIALVSRRLIMKYALNTMKDIISDNSSRGLNMWRNYVLEVPSPRGYRRVSARARHPDFRTPSLGGPFRPRFSHKGSKSRCVHTYDRRFSPCYANGSQKKRGEAAFTPLRDSLFLVCDFPKCPTKVFRISFSVLRSQYAAVLQAAALVASVGRRSHNTGRFALSSRRITHFVCVSLARATHRFFSRHFFFFLLHCNATFLSPRRMFKRAI